MSRVPFLLSFAFACLLLATAPGLAAGDPYLIRDFEDEVYLGGSDPAYGAVLATPAGERLTFFARDENHGDQLWWTDGTRDGTRIVADLGAVSRNLDPFEFTTSFRQVTVFDQFVDLVESWVTDGTADGMQRICQESTKGARIACGLIGEVPGRRLAVFLRAEAVWVTDVRQPPRRLGTLAQLGEAGGGPGDRLIVPLFDEMLGQARLWTTDGTVAGSGWVGTGPDGPVEVENVSDRLLADGRLLFVGRSSVHGLGLWVTDGTAAGTRLILDPETDSSAFPQGSPTVTADGSRAYVSARLGDVSAPTLLVTDGTPAGTVILREPGGWEGRYEVFGDRVLYTVATDSSTSELWAQRSPLGGEALFSGCADCVGSPRTLFPSGVVPEGRLPGDRFFFTVSLASGATGLWESDGTPEGTRFVLERVAGTEISLFADLPGGAVFVLRSNAAGLYRLSGSRLTLLTRTVGGVVGEIDGRVVYAGTDADGYPEPWVTDGTVEGTFLLGDLAQGDTFRDGEEPRELTALGDRLLFLLRDPFTNTDDLWITDGSAAGTQALTDLPDPGNPHLQGPRLEDLVEVDGFGLFLASDPQTEITSVWITDGTPGGTRSLLEAPGTTLDYGLTAGDRFAYFRDFLGGPGVTVIDPRTRLSFELGISASPGATLGGAEYFLGSRGPDEFVGSLWRTDGTEAGTVEVADGWSFGGGLTVLDGRIYFVARQAGGDDTLWLWESDGTALGTGPVVALAEGRVGLTYRAGSKLFLVSYPNDDLTDGVWVSDGTAAGTERIFADGELQGFEPFGQSFAFIAQPDGLSRELYLSDGTVSGTRVVTSLGAETWLLSSGVPAPRLAGVGDRLFFSATDLVHGVELWETDGTPAGTRRLTDIAPGVFSSDPQEMTVLDGRLYFTASDNRRGRELWALPLDEDDGGGGGSEPPAPPAGAWIETDEIPGYRFKARITDQQGDRATAAQEPGCIDETLCLSGRVPGRSEAFVRIVGPKPNGFFWPTLAKFTTSQVEVWIERLADGADQYYLLPGATADGPDTLPALFDRGGFPGPGVPASLDGKGASAIDRADATGPVGGQATGPPIPPGSTGIISPEQPGFRFHVRLTSQTGEVLPHREELDCIDETVCVSGSVPGRSELFLRVIGPRPNGMLWPTLVRFTTSRAEVWIEQLSSGAVQYYDLPAATPGDDRLDGLFDRQGFVP